MQLSELKKAIPAYIIKLSETLQQNGFEAHLVGGSVRDLLLGQTPADYDVATNAYPEEIEKIFAKSVPTGAKFGTMTVVVSDDAGERYDVEVTTYRREEDYVGGRWPAKVEFTRTIEEDLARRDFTINAMALDLQNFDTDMPFPALLKDPYSGMKDLRLKIIRAVGDAVERFSEDGLRPIRACRLAAQLGFVIEPQTFAAIRQTNYVTEKVSSERMRDELMKLLLKSKRPSIGLKLMQESGLLKLMMPELEEGIGVTQPEFHSDDVFTHSLKACDVAEDSIKLIALLHDIGKPRTMTKDEFGTHFYGHDIKGAEIAKEIMTRLKFSNAEIDRASNLIRWHMFYYPSADWRKNVSDNKNKVALTDDQVGKVLEEKGAAYQGGWTDSAVRRLIRNVGGVDAINDLMKLRIADATANPKAEFNPKEVDILAERISDVLSKEMAIKISDLNVTGTELMEKFKLEPGKLIGQILEHLLEIVIEDPALNRKEQLLEFAQDYLSKNKQ